MQDLSTRLRDAGFSLPNCDMPTNRQTVVIQYSTTRNPAQSEFWFANPEGTDCSLMDHFQNIRGMLAIAYLGSFERASNLTGFILIDVGIDVISRVVLTASISFSTNDGGFSSVVIGILNKIALSFDRVAQPLLPFLLHAIGT